MMDAMRILNTIAPEYTDRIPVAMEILRQILNGNTLYHAASYSVPMTKEVTLGDIFRRIGMEQSALQKVFHHRISNVRIPKRLRVISLVTLLRDRPIEALVEELDKHGFRTATLAEGGAFLNAHHQLIERIPVCIVDDGIIYTVYRKSEDKGGKLRLGIRQVDPKLRFKKSSTAKIASFQAIIAVPTAQPP